MPTTKKKRTSKSTNRHLFFHRKTVIYILLVICAASFTLLAYNIRTSLARNQAIREYAQIEEPPTSEDPIPTGPSLAQLVALTTRYEHPLGFSIVYPKKTLGFASCEGMLQSEYEQVPLALFELPLRNTIYFSPETYVHAKNKKMDGAYTTDPSTCVLIPNSPELIQKGIDNGIEDVDNTGIGKSTPPYLEVHYRKIRSPRDIQALVDTLYPNCTYEQSNRIEARAETYMMKLVDKEVMAAPSARPCIINFAYTFFYSPENKVAILTNGYQEPPFTTEFGMSMPLFEFP